MNFFTLFGVELRKIKRSGILPIQLAATVICWLPSVLHADMNFQMQAEGISPENSFFIQGFLGMSWFLFPAGMVVCTVLLSQLERTDRGILKMCTLPVKTAALCMAKFAVLLCLAAVQLCMMTGMYCISAAVASEMCGYLFLLPFGYVCEQAGIVYLSAVPMAAFFWMLSVCIRTPVFAIGAGFASIVPSVLAVNTKLWAYYPVCYPFFVVTAEYGKLAKKLETAPVALVPWIPAAALLTVICLVVACICFGRKERGSI